MRNMRAGDWLDKAWFRWSGALICMGLFVGAVIELEGKNAVVTALAGVFCIAAVVGLVGWPKWERRISARWGREESDR